MTELEAARRTLFDQDALDVSNIKLFPGTNRDISPEQMAEQINKAIAQLLTGDYEEITEATED